MKAVRHVKWWGLIVGLAMIGSVQARAKPSPSPADASPTPPAAAASPSTAPVEVSPSPAAAPSEAPVASPSATVAPTPTAPPPTTVHAIWDYQKEIGLTTDQVSRIKKTIRDLQSQADHAKTHFQTANHQLEQLLSQDSSDIEQIRTKMHELASIEIDMQVENIKAKRNLHHIMTTAQLQKWRTIQQGQQQ